MKKLFSICLAMLIISTITAMLTVNAYNVISPTAPTYSQVTEDENRPDGKDDDNTKPNQSDYSTLPRHTETETFTNQGKDDPDSPNYTGDHEDITKDKSAKSPDTGSKDTEAAKTILIISLFGVFIVVMKAVYDFPKYNGDMDTDR